MLNSHRGKLDLILSDVVPEQVNVSVTCDPVVPLDEYTLVLTIRLRRSAGPVLFSLSETTLPVYRQKNRQELG